MPGNRCETCRFWNPPAEPYKHIAPEDQRTCHSRKMSKGYGQTAVPKDGALVENDEGWAILVGPEFGCVNYEERM